MILHQRNKRKVSQYRNWYSTAIGLQPQELQRLQEEVNPLCESDNYGIDLYQSTLRSFGYT